MVETETANSKEFLFKRIDTLLTEGVRQISIFSVGDGSIQYSYCKKGPKNRGVKYKGKDKEDYLE